jgi:DNA-binding response OmpR family regulator
MARILIVEDEQIIVEDLRLKLAQMGHEVIGAPASGKEAVRLAESVTPDLVLMDVRLEGPMEGTEAGHRIQRSTGAPVIFLTACPGVFIREPGKMLPPGLCLTKPFSKDQLQTVIDSVLAPPKRSIRK